MQKLEVREIIRLIENRETFEAEAADGSFAIKVNRYVPFFCTAIHEGSQLRESLKDKIALEDYDRWYEEDPHTAAFIESMPLTIIGLDSRYEYDLNRRPEDCIHEEAWGKQVWKKPLKTSEKHISKQKHKNYYRVTFALVKKLTQLFESCVVYDIHSYNYQRWDRDVPLFNIGIEKVDSEVFGNIIDNWLNELRKISIPGIKTEANTNDVFFGRGYNLEFITKNFPNVLVLATEVKKVFCNELTGEEYPNIIKDLQHQLKQAILNNAYYYSQAHTSWSAQLAPQLLDKKHDPAIYSIDKKLYKLLKNFELLAYVNPINTTSQKKKFVKSKFTQPPKFSYSPIKVHPYELKQQLSALRVQDISDVSIRHLYEAVINAFFDKIDLLASLDSKKFLYNSLRYFGRPSKKDLQNAEYILHLPLIPTEPKHVPYISGEVVVNSFKEALDSYGIKCKIELSSKVISQVMVLNSKKTCRYRWR